MIRAFVSANGASVDTFDGYGMIYLSSDHVFAAPTKGFESSSYAEEEGEHILPETVDAPFDYKVRFLVMGSLGAANEIIRRFNSSLYTVKNVDGGQVKEYKEIAYTNSFKRHTIVGYGMPITEATEYYRDRRGRQADAVIVEWTIHVTEPSKCSF